MQRFQDIVNYRRQNNVVRKDFIELLMQLMDTGVLEDDDNEGDSTESGNRYAIFITI